MPDTPRLTDDEVLVYDPELADVPCRCGHAHYRHFDSYDDMRPVGCKYCECQEWVGLDGQTSRQLTEVVRLRSSLAQWRQVAGTCGRYAAQRKGLGLPPVPDSKCARCGHPKSHHDLLARLMEESE